MSQSQTINVQNLDLNQVIANDQFGEVLSNLSRQMLSDLKFSNREKHDDKYRNHHDSGNDNNIDYLRGC